MAAVRHLGLFPWCIFPNKQAVKGYFGLDESDYQFNINTLEGLSQSISVAMAWYWIVKKWKAEGSFEVIGPSNDIITVTYEYTFDREIVSETQLVCAPTLKRQEPLLEYSHPDFIGLYPMESAQFDIGRPDSLYGNLRISGLRAPNNEIYNWNIISFLPNASGDIGGGAVFSAGAQEGRVPISVPVEAFNKTYQVPAFRSGLLNAEVSIKAIEYWPYDPEDGGGPIYDSATGEQLRSF